MDNLPAVRATMGFSPGFHIVCAAVGMLMPSFGVLAAVHQTVQFLMLYLALAVTTVWLFARQVRITQNRLGD